MCEFGIHSASKVHLAYALQRVPTNGVANRTIPSATIIYTLYFNLYTKNK